MMPVSLALLCVCTQPNSNWSVSLQMIWWPDYVFELMPIIPTLNKYLTFTYVFEPKQMDIW